MEPIIFGNWEVLSEQISWRGDRIYNIDFPIISRLSQLKIQKFITC